MAAPSVVDIQASILAQTIVAANQASAAAQTAIGAVAGSVPAPTSSVLPKNIFCFCQQLSGVAVNDGDEVDGASIYPAAWSGGGWLRGSVPQEGTWKSVAGLTLQSGDFGMFVRSQ